MKYCFGGKLRAVRERRGLTLREVAERAGVSESLVSQIERDRVSPAIDTLLSLSDALDIDAEHLFSDLRRERAFQVVRRTERGSFTRPAGVRYERLVRAGKDRDGIEAYVITIEPGARTAGTEYGHPGWELGVVEEGMGEVTVGVETVEVGEGDSVSFKADSPHVIANTGEAPLRVFWVVSPPKDISK